MPPVLWMLGQTDVAILFVVLTVARLHHASRQYRAAVRRHRAEDRKIRGASRERRRSGRRCRADRRTAARLAASHPQRECRAAHLPHLDRSFRRRARRARGAPRSRAPRRRIAAGPDLHDRGSRTRTRRRAAQGNFLRRARRAGLSGAAAHDRRRAAAHRACGPSCDAHAADDRHRRLAQCIGGRREIRRTDRAATRRCRICDRVGPRARDRRGRASRQSRVRNGRRARRRARSYLSGRARSARATAFANTACCSAKCRCHGSRAAAIFPAATG